LANNGETQILLSSVNADEEEIYLFDYIKIKEWVIPWEAST